MGTKRTRDVEAPERTAAPGPVASLPAAPVVARTAAERDMQQLQRTIGNRAAVAWLQAGQAKLEVGPADDPYEHEADRVAREVVANLRAQGPGAGPVADDEHAPARRISRRVQRRVEPEVGLEGGDLREETESAINAARGSGGAPLPQRESFEAAFGGADLSGVRVHSGSQASELNRRVAAKAFTVGSDIFFDGPAPDASSASGQELLAHELTHTIQQS